MSRGRTLVIGPTFHARAFCAAPAARALFVVLAVVVDVAFRFARALPATELSIAAVCGILAENAGIQSTTFSGEAMKVGAAPFAVQCLGLAGGEVAVVLVRTIPRVLAVHTDAHAAHAGRALAVRGTLGASRQSLLAAVVLAELVRPAVGVTVAVCAETLAAADLGLAVGAGPARGPGVARLLARALVVPAAVAARTVGG